MGASVIGRAGEQRFAQHSPLEAQINEEEDNSIPEI
jgi:hypothetical protein